eukprot:GFYU01017468.1.p1 GENE.GFYU01017468.1~~GFYU01017468.1.p1  ORF type:complete len:198 (+),score=72.06 GFYU01017468.1:72-665(+)
MASFKFTSQNVDSQLYKDIPNVNSFEDDQLKQLVGSLLDFLAQGDDLMEALQRFAEEHEVNGTALKNTVRGLLFFFKSAQTAQLSQTHVKEDLIQFGVEEDKAAIVSAVWKSKLGSLSKHMIMQSLMVNQLVDMEWVFGVTASNSDVDQIGSTFLKLKLVLDKGTHKEDVYMELTIPQFYQFLGDMEKARSQMNYLA